MRNFVKIILAAVIIVSCNNHQQVDQGDNVIYMPLKNPEKTQSLEVNRAAFQFDTVSLETTSESMISLAKDIRIDDSILFVQNGVVISLFSYDGSFIRNVGHIGRGPGEYLSLCHFDINPEKDLIYILDDMGRKIMVYSYSGEMKRAIQYDGFPVDFAVMPDGELLLYYPQNNSETVPRGLWRADSDGVLKEHLVSIDPDFTHIVILNHYLVHINPETVGFMGLEDRDEFYHITSDTSYMSYRMMTDYSISKSVLKAEESPKTPLTTYMKNGYLETDSLLIFTLSDKRSIQVRSILRKTDNELFRVYIKDMKDILSDRFPSFEFCYNGYLITKIDMDLINSVISGNVSNDPVNPKLLIMKMN